MVSSSFWFWKPAWICSGWRIEERGVDSSRFEEDNITYSFIGLLSKWDLWQESKLHSQKGKNFMVFMKLSPELPPGAWVMLLVLGMSDCGRLWLSALSGAVVTSTFSMKWAMISISSSDEPSGCSSLSEVASKSMNAWEDFWISWSLELTTICTRGLSRKIDDVENPVKTIGREGRVRQWRTQLEE